MIAKKKILDLRILFVHSGADLYGASRSLLRLSSRLVLDGAEVKVVLPYNGPLVSALTEKGVDVVLQDSLPVIERWQVKNVFGVFRLLTNFLKSTVGLVQLANQFRPSLIHTMTAVILSPGLVAMILNIPHIWHVRESFGEFRGLWRYYQKYMIFFSSKIICVSSSVAGQFDNNKQWRKIHVIHNGFPVEEFSKVDMIEVKNFRSPYIKNGVQYLIGMVGRIKFHRKGQDDFVRAAKLLQDKFPEARFLCIGSPFPGNESHLTNLLALIEELEMGEYVIYTGDAKNVKAAIAGLDVLVLASAQPEPFAGVVIEAMALSRPVVATAMGGSSEQVVDGVTGYLVQPADPNSMANAIEKLLNSSKLRDAFGQNGHARFLSHFEFEAFYQKIGEVYTQVIR